MTGIALAPSLSRAGHRIPVVAHYETAIGVTDREKIAALARSILAEEPNISRIPPFAPELGVGLVDAPSLVLEDHSGILLAHEGGADTSLSYRAMFLAGEGDLVAVYGQRNRAFEIYCRDTLGLGHVEVIAPQIESPDESLSLACIADRDLRRRAVDLAHEAGALNVLPYMATGGVWRLAGEIAAETRLPVRVAGPPPNLVRAVNDKMWFTRRAAALLGDDAVPPCRTIHGMSALVANLQRFARSYATIALKLSHCAASQGNLVLDGGALTGLSPIEVSKRLTMLMHDRGWHEFFPLQLTVWEAPLIATPSAQVWIPSAEDGPPVVEGIFDQHVVGLTARFSGAAPTSLAREWRDRIAGEAARLGTLLQELGYFGRCSFDAIVVEHHDEASQLHWVECNGRWGGVSIPMTLANRLTGDWGTIGLLIVDRKYERLAVSTAAEFFALFAGSLLVAGEVPEGAVLLSPGRIEQGAVELLFLGRDDADVRARSDRLLAALAG